jgi:hypothetical protein
MSSMAGYLSYVMAIPRAKKRFDASMFGMSSRHLRRRHIHGKQL